MTTFHIEAVERDITVVLCRPKYIDGLGRDDDIIEVSINERYGGWWLYIRFKPSGAKRNDYHPIPLEHDEFDTFQSALHAANMTLKELGVDDMLILLNDRPTTIGWHPRKDWIEPC